MSGADHRANRSSGATARDVTTSASPTAATTALLGAPTHHLDVETDGIDCFP